MVILFGLLICSGLASRMYVGRGFRPGLQAVSHSGCGEPRPPGSEKAENSSETPN